MESTLLYQQFQELKTYVGWSASDEERVGVSAG